MTEEEFYLEDLKSRFNGLPKNEYYLSYSGGRDSHFLYWFIKEYLKRDDIEVVGGNTGMEHIEIAHRIYNNSDRILLPERKPYEVKETCGIPCFSKEQDYYVYYYQSALRKGKEVPKYIADKIYGKTEKFALSKKCRNYVLSGKAHNITHLCCYYLKKKPFHDYEEQSGKKAILGLRQAESAMRKNQITTCFAKNGKFRPIHDMPNELLEKIEKEYKIEVPSVYDCVTRTGCMGCPYGSYAHDTEKELAIIDDNQRNFCTTLFKESYDILGVTKRIEKPIQLNLFD